MASGIVLSVGWITSTTVMTLLLVFPYLLRTFCVGLNSIVTANPVTLARMLSPETMTFSAII
jgi:hypothetical protein